MQIRIFHLTEGAKQAEGLAVIIDVFRAFSLACYLFQNGAKRIIPVADVEEAYRLKAQHPEYILIGERNERKLPGFDFGNSPTHIEHVSFKGKTIVHTTSAGTQGIVNARNAADILTEVLSMHQRLYDTLKPMSLRLFPWYVWDIRQLNLPMKIYSARNTFGMNWKGNILILTTW